MPMLEERERGDHGLSLYRRGRAGVPPVEQIGDQKTPRREGGTKKNQEILISST